VNSTDAIAVFREEMNDEAEPFLWSTPLLCRYLDEAQKNFCRWTEGIEDATTDDITKLTITAGTDWYTMDPRVLKIREVVNALTGRPYKTHNMEEAAERGVFFNGRPGALEAFVTGLERNKLRAWPLPNAALEVRLRVFRLPMSSISDEDQELEIDEQHHMALLMWMKHRAYGKEDAETFDRSKRDDFEERFRRYCAEAKAEQVRRRHQAGTVQYGGL